MKYKTEGNGIEKGFQNYLQIAKVSYFGTLDIRRILFWHLNIRWNTTRSFCISCRLRTTDFRSIVKWLISIARGGGGGGGTQNTHYLISYFFAIANCF